ncbi:MAG: chromate transporter [Candidatus Izemoplasmatales bacterium]|nr:chromate transporter [Candidatus Izemoplasmatales bacterium]
MDKIWLLFITFFKVGLFTFGGGYAMIPMIEEEVLKHGWLNSVDLLVDFIAISESTPGPFAINIATFIGFDEAGLWGAIAATLGVVLPSFIIILFIARFFTRFAKNPTVNGFLSGVKPMVVGILVAVGVGLLCRSTIHTDLFHLSDWVFDHRTWVIAAVLLGIRLIRPKMNPIYLILFAAILGIVAYSLISI